MCSTVSYGQNIVDFVLHHFSYASLLLQNILIELFSVNINFWSFELEK